MGEKAEDALFLILIIGCIGFIFLFIGNTIFNITPNDSVPEFSQTTNGGFETGDLTGWSSVIYNGTIKVESGAAHSGNYGLNITLDARL